MPGEPGLVVIGHGPAGAAAAAAFRDLNPETNVKVFCGEALTCYSRPRLPEVVAGKTGAADLRLHPDAWYKERRIDICLRHTIARVDVNAQAVLDESRHSWPYRRLILATGADAVCPPIPGLPADRVFVLRTAADAEAVRLAAQGRTNAAVIGGGLLGLEAGFALTRLGLRVAVVESAARLLPRQVDAEGAGILQRLLEGKGFTFYLGEQVAEAESEPGRPMVLKLASRDRLSADLVLLSAGIAPRTALAREAGISVQRGILVNDKMETSAPGVYAAGDAAEWQGRIAGLWPAAQAMGRVAGSNAAGGNAVYPGQVPSTTLKVAGVDLCSQGNINPEGALITVRRDAQEQYWVKLFFRDRKLAGSLQIGRLTHALQYKQLMDFGLPVAGFEEPMLQDDFDFRRIPGFGT